MANKKIKFELTAVNKTKAAFDKVSGGLKKIGGGAKTAVKGIAGLGLAIAGAAGAIALLVKSSFDYIDAIGKTSTMTGIATSTIQAFHLAARESGTNIEGANKALAKFARSVGDAQRGLKTQQDIFKAINVELVDSAGNYRTMDAILADTAKGISNLGAQSEKATSLANLFGKQGMLLTGAIEDLSERGLDGFIERAENLGLILSNKTIRRVEAFNDAVGVIGMQFTAVKNNITTAFLPVFETLQKSIAEKMMSIKKSAGGFDQLGVDIAQSVIMGMAALIRGLGHAQLAIAEFFTGFNEKLRLAGLEYVKLLIIFAPVPKLLGLTAIEGKIKELNEEVANGVAANQEFKDQMDKTADFLLTLLPTIDDVRDSTKKLKDSTGESANAMFDNMNVLTAYKNSLDDVSKSLDQIAVNSMKKFEDSIVDGLKNGKLAFKDFATYVVEQLIRVAIQQLIIARLVDPFRTMLSGGKIGASMEYDRLTDGGTLFNGNGGGFTGMGARAGGVDGKGGFPAILHPNETVIDHTKGQGMGATVNFNISTVDAAGFDQLLASRKGLITSIINNAMNNQGKMGVV